MTRDYRGEQVMPSIESDGYTRTSKPDHRTEFRRSTVPENFGF